MFYPIHCNFCFLYNLSSYGQKYPLREHAGLMAVIFDTCVNKSVKCQMFAHSVILIFYVSLVLISVCEIVKADGVHYIQHRRCIDWFHFSEQQSITDEFNEWDLSCFAGIKRNWKRWPSIRIQTAGRSVICSLFLSVSSLHLLSISHVKTLYC